MSADEDKGGGVMEAGMEDIKGLGGPMTRARAKKAKEALKQMVANLIKRASKIEGPKCDVEEAKLICCIQNEDHED